MSSALLSANSMISATNFSTFFAVSGVQRLILASNFFAMAVILKVIVLRNLPAVNLPDETVAEMWESIGVCAGLSFDLFVHADDAGKEKRTSRAAICIVQVSVP